jgi:hypothetical protein
MTAVGSCVASVDAVVTEVVDVRVEESCCSPWQTYCLVMSAAPASPFPKKRDPNAYMQEKEDPLDSTNITPWSSVTLFPSAVSMLLVASFRASHAASSSTSL